MNFDLSDAYEIKPFETQNHFSVPPTPNMNGAAFGQPRPLSFPVFPVTASRFANSSHPAPFSSSTSALPSMSPTIFSHSHRAPYGPGPGYMVRTPLPLRMAYPQNVANSIFPGSTYGFPTSAFGVGASGIPAHSAGLIRPGFAQPISKHSQDVEDVEEEEEEIDVVGGIEEDDIPVDGDDGVSLTEEMVQSGSLDGERNGEKTNGDPQRKNAEEANVSSLLDDDDEEVETASSDEEEPKRDGTIEEDGLFEGGTDVSTTSSGDASRPNGETTAEGERKVFPCKSCPKSFLANHSLKRHVKEIHEGIRFQCPKCFECYTRMTSYNQHVCHANWRKAKARQIDSKYSSGKARASKHRSAKSNDTACAVCGKSFLSTMAMQRHLLETHGKLRYSCPVCGESYTRIEGYRKHRCGSSFRKAKLSAVEDFLANSRPPFDFSASSAASFTASTFAPPSSQNLFSQTTAFDFMRAPTAPSAGLSTRNSTNSEVLSDAATLGPIQLKDSEANRNAIVRHLDHENSTLESLVGFIYSHYPPKDKRRFGSEDMNRFQLVSLGGGPESRKKRKQLLLKVLQDYHPDKVDAAHGQMWAFVCNEISKRLNFHFENLK